MNNRPESLFFIAISPVGQLQERINAIKTDIYQKYQLKGAFRSPAHITLQMPFKKKLSKISKIKEDLSLFAQNQKAFEIEIDGFGCFEPRVIHINVLKNEVLHNLQYRMQKLLKLHQIFGSNYKDQAFHPHITVAFRDLKKDLFYSVWEDYNNKQFKDSFRAEGLTLYEFKKEKWEISQYFPFQFN